MYQAKDFKIAMLETGKVEECYVSHVTDPENFYIQLSTSTDTLEQMATALANQSPSGEEHVWHLGDPCGAVFDQQWSRGRVTGTPHRQEHLEVTFVDYGNKDYLLKKDVCPLSPEMLTIPVLSHHCCLEGVTCSESFWAPENIAKFEDLVMDKELTAHIVSYDELQDVYHLLLFDENQASINEEFARLSGSVSDGNKASPSLPSLEGTAANKAPGVRYSSQSSLPPLKMGVGDRVNISIVHLPSPSEWWCNMTSYSEALKSLTKQMGQTYGSMGPGDCVLDNMQPGTLCAVLNQAENRWERASIEKVVGTSVTVTAVDLGLKDTVPAGRVKELREEFRKLPAQAVLCCLHGLVSECGAWTENACNLFRDLVGAKFFTATVMEKDGDGRLHMNLMDCVTNSNVATTFLGKCGEASRGTPPPLHPSVEKEVPRHPAVSVKTPSKSKVLLSWINTPGDFYIQLGENMTQIEKITQTLETACNSPQAQPARDVSVGALVAARFSEDQEWYRAVVKSTAKQSSVVEFVDFGNVDSVATDSLQELGPELRSLPAQALRCSLVRVRPLNQGSTWSGDAREFLDKLTAKGALCHFLSRQGDRYEVDLEVEGKDIAREMIDLAVVRGSTPEAASAGSPRVQRYQFVEPRVGQTYRGYVAFIQSVESFYVQLADRMEDLEKLMEDLQTFYEAGKGRPVSSFVTGLPCAAKYEDDEQWYRAKIRSFTLRDADIFFVDYGNTQSSPKGSVFQLDPAFVSRMEALALHCRLGVAESRSPEAQVDQFNDFTENEELEVVIKGKEGSKLLVDLMKNGVSLTQELRSGHSTKAAPVEKVVSGYTPGKVSPGQTVSAFVSYIESPARFWVQLAGCDDELTSLMRSLRSHYNSGAEDPLSNPTPGQPCVAMYEEDKEWYRASVMSVHGTEIKVQFVDYGNTDLVDRQKVRPISAGFMSSPLLAVECCLEGFQSCSMADDAVCLMESLMSEQELSVTFRGPKTVTVKAANIEIAQALRNNGLGTPQRSPMSQTSPLQPSPRGKNPPVGGSPFSTDSRSSSGSPNSGGPFLVFKEAVPPSGSAEAIMTHVDKKSGMIYMQLLSSESQLQQLSSRLQSLFSHGGSPLQQGSLTKGLACCAQFSQDQCWYRAIVQQVRGPNAGVLFVDYGNDDTVPISNLKSIPADLMESPKHAFECKLKGLKSWTPQAYKALCRCMDEQLNVRFVTSSSPFEIQASVNGQDLLQLMFKSPASSPSQASTDSRSDTRDSRNSRQTSHPPSRQNGFAGTGQSYKKPEQQSFGSPRDQKQTWDKGLKPRYSAQSASPNSPAKEPVVEQVFEAQTVPVGEQAACVTTISEDGTFCVQLVRDLTVIDELTAKIEKCPSVPHPCPCVGAACGARYSEDGGWYRGLVKAVAGSSAHVVFVDFGNEETCPLDSLKPLPAHLLTPPLAYLCQAGGVKLTAEQQEAFTAASAEKEYSVTFRGSAPYDVIVKEENGTNLMETIFRPTAIPPPQAPSKTVHAIVSHVGQDRHFYLQLYSQLDAIANFREEIQTACGEHTEKMDSVAEGQFCFAKFSEDEAWYRAAVLKVSGDEVMVLFVDYGNEDTLDKSQLLAMPPAFMARPAWAFNCKIPKMKKWSEGQKRKFEAMTDGKLMNAHFLTSAPPYEVELTLDIGLELEEDEDEVVEEKPAEEPSENVEVEQPEETPEDSGDAFEDAQEEPAAELEENAEELPGMAQEGTKDTAELESGGGEGAKLESGEAPGPDLQEPPESAPPVRGPDSDKAAAVLEYPSQTPPALDACIVSHLNEDGTFYLQLLSDDESREKLSEKLQEECESPDSKTVVRPSVNLPCCAKFSDDEAWYRAIIEKVDDEMVTVLFVDFGNKDDVGVGDLRELAAESLQVPPLAYKCVLEDCDTQLVSSKLEEATADQTLTVTFSTTEIIPYSVNLQLEDGINISTVLLKPAEELSSSLVLQEVSEPAEHRADDGVCAADRKAVALVPGQRVKVTVSDAASPSLFHVQIDENLPALEEMSDAMFEHYSSLAEEDGTVDSVAEGQLCACQFGEDGSWYRAVVQSMDAGADSCRLFYVDYGNADTVPKSSVRELPAEFQALPWQCVSCSLAGVCCPQEWSEEAKAAFEEMVSNKSVTAEVLRGDGIATPYLVHVFDQGKSVADSLLGLNLPGVDMAEIPATPSTAQALAAETNSSSAAEAAKPSYESLSEETVESGLVEKEDVEEKEALENLEESEQEFSQHLHKCSAQETIDDLDESEQEFSRQLQACTARMESTLVEEARSSRQKGNSTTWEEPSAIGSQEGQGKEEEEEEDDFEDAVEAEQNSAEEDGNVSEEAQVACGCVSDGLAELEWLDIHVCVAVSASEFWCQLPNARSILAGTTLGIERAHASGSGGVREVRVGHLYLVCDPPHTNYRGKVLSEEGGGVVVLKVDYGTEERVAPTCLHPLARHQLELPAQAFCCCLGDAGEVRASQEWLDNLITQGEAVDSDLQVKVVGRKANGVLLVDVQERPGSSKNSSSQAAEEEESEGDVQTSSSKPVGGEVSMDTLEISQPVLQSTILGDTMAQYHLEKSEGGENDYLCHSLDDFKDYRVTVAPGGEPDSFYVVKASSQGLLEALADEIEEDVKESVDSLPDGESLAVNSPCLVLEQSSATWFRGQVRSTGERLKVLCVDRGVVLEVGKEEVRELPTRLLDTPVQAVLCRLADVVPVEDQWCEAALTLFTDFISSGGPLKVTSQGLCPDSGAHRVTLRDESQSEGSVTRSIVGVECSINRSLVELGYAEAVPGSPLEVALQVERTINDPDTIDQMETSFTEQSLLRENSLGDESDVEENREEEEEQDAIKASGDAPSMATESDEESKQQ